MKRSWRHNGIQVQIAGTGDNWTWRIESKPGIFARAKQQLLLALGVDSRSVMEFYRTGHARSYDEAKNKAERSAKDAAT